MLNIKIKCWFFLIVNKYNGCYSGKFVCHSSRNAALQNYRNQIMIYNLDLDAVDFTGNFSRWNQHT